MAGVCDVKVPTTSTSSATTTISTTTTETCQEGCCWQGPSRYIIQSLGRADGIKSWPEKYPSVEACAKRCEDLPDCKAFHYYGPGDEAYQACFLQKGGVIGPQLKDGRVRMAGVCDVKVPTEVTTTTLQSPTTSIEGPAKLAAACDDAISVYFDGDKALEGHDWSNAFTVDVPAATEIIGIACKDNGGLYGIVASTDDGVVTDDTWVCSSKYVEGWTKPGFQDTNNDFSSPSTGNNYNNGPPVGIAAEAKSLWGPVKNGWAYCKKVFSGPTPAPPTSVTPTGGDSWELGWCLDSSGNDQNSGTVSLGLKSSMEQCLNDCKKTAGATGCEYSRNHCQVHTQDVASGSGQSSHHCYVLTEKDCCTGQNEVCEDSYLGEGSDVYHFLKDCENGCYCYFDPP